jgi:hypothetical protein
MRVTVTETVTETVRGRVGILGPLSNLFGILCESFRIFFNVRFETESFLCVPVFDW